MNAPTDKDSRPAPADRTPDVREKQPRFIDLQHTPRQPLGRLRTDEEARLASEIEKLRG